MITIITYRLGKYLFFLWSMTFTCQSYSQNFTCISYDERNGLNRNYIYDIARDQQGYYWLATEKGIVRFDGNHFTTFPLTEIFGNNSAIVKLHLYKNNLFLIYEQKGCLKFNVQDLSIKTITEATTDDVLQENDSTFYLLLKNNLLKKNASNKTINSLQLNYTINKNINLKKGILTKWGSQIAILHLSQKIILIDNSDLKAKKIISVDSIELQNSFGIKSNKLQFSGNSRLFSVDKKGHVTANKDFILSKSNNYTECKFSSKNGYYILNKSKLYLYENKSATLIDIKELKNKELKIIYVQDKENLLIGTNAGLIYLSNKKRGNYYFEDNNETELDRLRIRRKILPWKKNDLLLLGHPYNYIYENSGKISLLTKYSASSFDAVQVGNKLYIATEDKGIHEYNIETGIDNEITKNILSYKRRYFCILYNRKDSLLVSAYDDTVITYNLKTRKFKTIASAIPAKNIKVIRLDTLKNDYWIGTEGGVFKVDADFNPKKGSSFVVNNLHGNSINDILFDENGLEIWIAHENGIDKIRKNTRQLTDSVPPSSFKNPKVVSLIQDNKKRIWMGTYSGIVAYDSKSKGLIKLSRLNGLINTEFNYAASCKINDELFIFGGLSGYDAINPTLFPINTSLPIGLVTGYEITKDNNIEFHAYDAKNNKPIRFNTEDESIRIFLGTTNTLTPYKYTYQFRYNDESWSNSTNTPNINISKVQPGIYNLEIRAFDEFQTMISFRPITILANIPFYKSRLFIALLSIFLISSLIFIIFLILRNQKRENELKESISMDLHDEIGTLLARAMIVSQTKLFPDKESHLSKYLSEALHNLRVYINTMNAGQLSAIQLSSEIKEMLHLSFSPLNYSFKMEEIRLEGIKLNASKFRCLKICFYEILNNMICHSHGNAMQILIEASASKLILIFEDNGNISNLSNFSNKGNGIRNLKKRVNKQKGEIIFEIGKKGYGLAIKIELPY